MVTQYCKKMNELHFKRVRKADHQSETPVCREDLFFCLYPTNCASVVTSLLGFAAKKCFGWF